MIKKFVYALPALLCFASPALARHPYAYDISDTQSVLIRADDAAVAADAADANEFAPPVPQAEVGANVTAQPNAAEATSAVESAPMMSSQPYPTYRTVRPARRSNGLGAELIELERRKNAWLRRTFLGR